MTQGFITDIRQAKQFKYYTFFAMLYVTLMIISMLLPWKIIKIGNIIEPGGIFIFPFTYYFADVIAEVYGYTLSRRLVWCNLFCLFIFGSLVSLVVHVPSPASFHLEAAYSAVLGPSFRLFIALALGLFISDFVNIYILTKWKILLKGRYFWVRSITSTALCEIIFNIVTYFFTYLGKVGIKEFFLLVLFSWLFKIVYALLAVGPATMLVRFLKYKEGVDIYDYETNFNPFKV